MPDLFGLDIAGIINEAIGDAGGVLSLVLIKTVQGARKANPTEGFDTTEISYPCNGFMDKKNARRVKGTLTKMDLNIVVILGASLQSGIVPEQGDKITIEGETLKIDTLPERDPAAATYNCRVT